MNGWARVFHIGLLFGGALLPFISANAQTSASTQTAKAEQDQTVRETVTVKATRPAVQVLPDRTVYSLDNNILSSTGTLSDALGTIPSVDVDIDGNVALRGDGNVLILIDGKKSPLLAGNRADALQQIPADMIDRIEVITNPPAEFRAEGSAGIINIILKKNKELVASGVVRVNVGDQGRLNGSLSGNYKLGPVFLHGGHGERRDRGKSTSSTLRGDGSTLDTSQQGSGQYIYSGQYTYLFAMMDLNARDRIDGGGSYSRFTGHGNSELRSISITGDTDTTRTALGWWQNESVGGRLQYQHHFAKKGEVFKLDVSHDANWARNNSDYTDLETATATPTQWQSRKAVTGETHTGLQADYILPLGEAFSKTTAGSDQFKIGYALQTDTNRTDRIGLLRAATDADWSDDTNYTSNFFVGRTTHAGYVSYARKFGAFGVETGLRMELDFLHTDLRTTGEVHDTQALGFYPSAHLSYDLTDTQVLRLSYSRRMNRPKISDLNPARTSSDSFNISAGNPGLQPEQVDSFDASYHYIGDAFDLVTTGYYRATYNGITSGYRYLSDTVLLTTKDNLARRMASGVETDLRAVPFSGVTLRLSGRIAYNEFNPGATGAGVKTSGVNWNLKGGIDWQVMPGDTLQFDAKYKGLEHFAQGYSDPTLSGNLGLKHNFGSGVSAVVSIHNLFNSQSNTKVLDSPGLHQVSHSTKPGRIFYFGLVYTFGGARDTGEPESGNDNSAGMDGVPGVP